MSSVNKKSSGLCKSYALSKSCRLPFFPSTNKATVPIAKIHCDLWGPAPVLFNQAFRYYTIFVDDFSHFTWLYPLKRKSDFYRIFFNLQAMVEKQFQREIQVFHSDSSGEFTKHEFIDHLLSTRIVHLLSCLGTLEQNCVVERKHRHVVKLGLAMLLHASAPKHFWVDAFLTTTFLINRLPLPSFGMHSPYFLLHQKKPTYDFLRTFGCQCFLYLGSYAKDKLEPRSLPCIFVGYNDKHKGYRCLHLSTRKVYTSRHAPPVFVP